MQIDVRRLGPEDVQSARRVVRAFHGRSVAPRYLAGLLGDTRNLLLVAEVRGGIVGFVCRASQGPTTED